MTGGFPLLGSFCNPSSIGDQSFVPVQLTAPGSINTKGAWLQLVASSANDCVGLMLKGVVGGVIGTRTSIDIGVGAGGSEIVVVADLFSSIVNIGNAGYQSLAAILPVNIPAGTRISARYQTTNLSIVAFAGADLFDGGFTQSSGTAIDTIGFTAGTTASTSMTAGTAGSKGAYAAITTSSANDYAGLFFGFDCSGSSTSTGNEYIDIAVGAGGSEKIIVPNYYLRANDAVDVFIYMPTFSPIFPVSIPAGTRISVRAAGDNGTAQGIVLYGIRA